MHVFVRRTVAIGPGPWLAMAFGRPSHVELPRPDQQHFVLHGHKDQTLFNRSIKSSLGRLDHDFGQGKGHSAHVFQQEIPSDRFGAIDTGIILKHIPRVGIDRVMMVAVFSPITTDDFQPQLTRSHLAIVTVAECSGFVLVGAVI